MPIDKRDKNWTRTPEEPTIIAPLTPTPPTPEASPRPWTMDENGEDGSSVSDAKNDLICETMGDTVGQAAANAALIVAAVNQHERLLACAEALRTLVAQVVDSGEAPRWPVTFAKCRTALSDLDDATKP